MAESAELVRIEAIKRLKGHKKFRLRYRPMSEYGGHGKPGRGGNKRTFHPKDLKSDERRARHPLGRVPLLEDGDVSICKSGGIVEYILEWHKNGGLKPAVDAAEYLAYSQ